MGLVISKGLTLRKEFQWNETVWNPSMISTALWLDAADASTVTGTANVTLWTDKSGNNRNATATTGPSLVEVGLNGRNFLRFDSNNENFSIAYPWPATQTTYIVTASNVETIESGKLGTIYSHTAGGGSFPNNTNISTHNGFVSVTQRSIRFEIASNATISFRRIDGLNLTAKNVDRFQFGIAGFAASNLDQGGGNVSIPSAYFRQTSSDLAEVIVLNSIATGLTREKLEGYLAHKWGLTANLPNDHPYKTVGPTP
jgi:hypothetical protein